MPRINIDDKLESQESFWRLLDAVKDRDKAIGMVVRFYRLAQQRYGHKKDLTKNDLEQHGLLIVADCGFAERNGDSMSVVNAEELFGWYRQICEASHKASEKRLSNKNNNLTSSAGDRPDNRVGDPVHPLAPSPSLAPSLSKKKNTYKADSKNPVFDFELLYKKYPRKERKSRGMAACKALVKTQEDYDLLSKAIDRYLEICKMESKETRFMFMFSNFVREWPEILNPETGISFKETIEERISRVIGNG